MYCQRLWSYDLMAPYKSVYYYYYYIKITVFAITKKETLLYNMFGILMAVITV